MRRRLRFALACVAGAAAWVATEVLGGLACLSAGIRLWRYEILPVFWAITSPVVWLLAALLIVPSCQLFDRAVGVGRLSRAGRAALRLAFLMSAGPVVEVLLNRYLFVGLLGRPLYTYLVLPTFGGSGSLLSPLYYATLYLHVPVADRLLGSYPSGASRSSSSETRTERAASIS